MDPTFMLFGWLVIIGVFGALWVCSVCLFFVGRRARSRLLTWSAGAVVCCLTLFALGFVALVVSIRNRSNDPQRVFEDTFHRKPPAGVSGIRSQTWSHGAYAWPYPDSGNASAYLRFQADHETFKRLLPAHLRPMSYDEYRQKTRQHGRASHPSWWVPPNTNTSEIHASLEAGVTPLGVSFKRAVETTVMTYDQGTETVCYHYWGIYLKRRITPSWSSQ